ncbi:KTSC domain-containing protein [Phenylobacterium sp.]|uniref:KTSC domain-containing protein n=1 Tax=Phenylobacterium sp. TaxID=1871053 RepID=UPI00286BCB91|nr:KTSC domain-containing protein [Phenylobacterium sp.]
MQVQSEAISDISYDAQRSKLFVTFDDGDAYIYVGVPGDVHRSFIDADSKGRFFAFEIRDRYPYNRI